MLLHAVRTARQRCRIHQIQMRIIDIESLLQQMNQTILFDHTIKALQYLALPIRAAALKLLQLFSLVRFEERPELHLINGVVSIEITWETQFITMMFTKRQIRLMRLIGRNTARLQLFQTEPGEPLFDS